MPDVVIVGAGPVGLLLAASLQRADVDVAVFERRADISTRPRAVGIHPPAVAALRSIGLELSGSRAIEYGEARDRERVLGRIEFEPPVFTLAQYELQRELESHVRRIRRATPVQRVEQHSDGARVSVVGGSVGARFVIAADGVDSGIRTDLDIPWQRRAGRARYLMADVAADGDDDVNGAILWFGTHGVVESFPLPEARRRWVVRTTTGDDLPRLVKERTGMRVNAAPEETSAFTAEQHVAERWVDGRIVLLGDAAHEISPIGGQGMNLGLLDAAALAPALVAALDGDEAALGDWQASRRTAAKRAVAQAAFNMAVGVPVPPVVQPARRAAIRTLAVSPLRRRLADTFTMQKL